MPKRVSTVRGREFGSGVRAAVEATGLSSRMLAEALDWDEAKLSNIVNGRGGASQLEVAVLLGFCRVQPAEIAHLLALYPETGTKGWWQEHGTCSPVRHRTVSEQLKAGKTLISWQSHMVSVFLQTPEYMQEVLRASATVPADEIADRVRIQQEMQEELRSQRLECTFYVHESALHLQVGDSEVRAGQLFHLLLMASWSNFTIRIVPQALGAHAGLAGPFTQLTFEQYTPLVWVETENSSLFVEAKDAITGYENIVRQLEKTSLDETASKALLSHLHEATDTLVQKMCDDLLH